MQSLGGAFRYIVALHSILPTLWDIVKILAVQWMRTWPRQTEGKGVRCTTAFKLKQYYRSGGMTKSRDFPVVILKMCNFFHSCYYCTEMVISSYGKVNFLIYNYIHMAQNFVLQRGAGRNSLADHCYR